MSRQVKIASGETLVQLPDGGHYDEGDVVDLTDEQFAAIDPALLGDVLIDQGAIATVDPVEVTIASGKNQVQLPNGLAYDSLEVVNLSAEDFAEIDPSLFPTYVTNTDDNLVFLDIPLVLADIADGEIASIVPGFDGTIVAIDFITTQVVTTGSKASTLGATIGERGAIVNGGVVSLTSAAATPAGKRIAGSAVIPTRAEVATLTIDATSGNFTLAYGGQTTANISEGVTAANLQTAFDLLSTVEPGDVVITGSAGGPFTFTWDDALGNVGVVTPADVTLAGGGDTIGYSVGTEGSRNDFDEDDEITIVASSTTAFVQGEGILRLTCIRA